MNDADEDLVRVQCNAEGCNHSFTLPFDAMMFSDMMNCGECGKRENFTVIEDPAKEPTDA